MSPFQPGNKLAKKKIGMKYSRTQTWDNYGMKFLSGYTDKYNELLEKLAVQEKITEPEKEFMDRYEKQLEYFRPKLQRKELTGSGGEKLGVVVYLPNERMETVSKTGDSTTE